LNTAITNNPIFTNFKEITKAGLAVSVVFSSVIGYLLGFSEAFPFSWLTLFLLAIGGYCMVGASNIFNQIIEIDLDAKMDRTKNRPLPSKRISKDNALFLGVLLTFTGLVLLYYINPKTAMFGAISIFMYVFLYTPLKTLTPVSVFVGAFPGAIPFMLGWVAVRGSFGIESGTLFLIQFFWQFPHFWAIGWFLFKDYEKGGFFMLPTGKQDKKTATQIILYTFWLIIASVLPVFGFTGDLKLSVFATIITIGLGIWMMLFAIKLYKKMDEATAKKLMLVSVAYITLLQVVYVADKFLRNYFL
jgi:heme o synthase